MSIDRDKLVRGAEQLGVVLSATQQDQFARYAELLQEWNERLNLTRIPPDEYLPLHFLDSLTVCQAVNLTGPASVVDVGTGAGFPGIPLKIAFPQLTVVLLDSTRKRLGFVEAVISELGLDGASTLHARVEEAGRLSEHHERYDIAVARAVAKMEVLAEWMLPAVRVGGTVIALKSRTVAQEFAAASAAIRSLGGGQARVVDVTIPETDVRRKLIAIPKVHASPTRRLNPKTPASRR